MNEQARPSANPFSLAVALRDAFSYVASGFVPLLRLSWKYLLFFCAVSAALFVLIGWLARNENETAIYFAIGGGLLLGFLASVAYYIAVVRHWLLGERNPRISAVYGPFLLRVLILLVVLFGAGLAVFAPLFAVGALGLEYLAGETEELPDWLALATLAGLAVLAVVTLLAATYVASRLTTWLAAAAVGQAQTLAEGWRATKGAGIRIAAGAVCLAVLFGVVDFIIELGLSAALGVTGEAFELLFSGEALPALFVLLLAKIAVYFLETAASMVFCASVYRQLSGG